MNLSVLRLRLRLLLGDESLSVNVALRDGLAAGDDKDRSLHTLSFRSLSLLSCVLSTVLCFALTFPALFGRLLFLLLSLPRGWSCDSPSLMLTS